MPPSKHRSGFDFDTKKKPVVEPKIRALKNDYAETNHRLRELIHRFEILAKDCKYKNDCIFCYIEFCPIVNDKK